MASFEHEILVDIIRDHPEALLVLLESIHGVEPTSDVEVPDKPESLLAIQLPDWRAVMERKPYGDE